MKKTFLMLALFAILALACNLSGTSSPNPTPFPQDATVTSTEIATEIPSATSAPATAIPTEMPAEIPISLDGIPVSFHPLNFTIPTGIASGISGNQFPLVDGPDIPDWELTPGHTAVVLDGYVLQGKFHEPQILIYPAMGYAEMFSGAFESMHRLRNVMNDSSLASVDQLPAVPFFDAAQIFASNVQPILFQNGAGIRFLTEYAQYPAPVNNTELIYHFQGFTDDGEYYIVAIFPITAPVLAETNEPTAVIPAGGVAYPDFSSTNPDFQSYYAAITDLLNRTSPDAFIPTINQLDQLIQSLQVTP